METSTNSLTVSKIAEVTNFNVFAKSIINFALNVEFEKKIRMKNYYI